MNVVKIDNGEIHLVGLRRSLASVDVKSDKSPSSHIPNPTCKTEQLVKECSSLMESPINGSDALKIFRELWDFDPFYRLILGGRGADMQIRY